MHNEHHTNHEAPGFGKNTNGLGIFLVAVIFVIIGLFCWWLWNNNNKEYDFYRLDASATGHLHNPHDDHAGENGHKAVTATAIAGTLDTVSGNFIYEVGENMEITLPDSAKTKMTVGKNSTEAKLYRFLTDNGVSVSEDKTQGWITCDRIYFESGASALTSDSKNQIERLAVILKAFPNATIKVGGYSDSTGNADVNTKLSGERALAVANGIQAASGIASIPSEGYGPLHPIADNATAEGRALNRRVDIRVTKK